MGPETGVDAVVTQPVPGPASCSRWVYYRNPAPSWATARAVALLKLGHAGQYHVGDHVDEWGGDGRWVRYQFATHPPDAQNPVEHLGVEVLYCADAGVVPTPPSGQRISLWTVEGLDVSDAQGTIDWPKVAATGRAFAFIKATEGLPGAYRQQANFKANWLGAKKVGIARGSYHYFRPTLDAAQQAVHHALTVRSVQAPGPGDFGPALDCEDQDGVSPAAYGAGVLAWCKTAAGLFGGKRPIVYCSPGVWAGMTTTATAASIGESQTFGLLIGVSRFRALRTGGRRRSGGSTRATPSGRTWMASVPSSTSIAGTARSKTCSATPARTPRLRPPREVAASEASFWLLGVFALLDGYRK